MKFVFKCNRNSPFKRVKTTGTKDLQIFKETEKTVQGYLKARGRRPAILMCKITCPHKSWPSIITMTV